MLLFVEGFVCAVAWVPALLPGTLFEEVAASEFCSFSPPPPHLTTLMSQKPVASELGLPKELAGTSACGHWRAELLI